MRNLILVFVALFVISGCSKDDDSQMDDSVIFIKGSISGNSLKSSEMKSADLLSLTDAKKVLVFNNKGYKLFSIKNNAFTAEANSGTATALAFLDEDNRYIGCLCSGGLNVLPLVSLKDGDNTVIDLSTLTLDGTSVIPANNPVGNEIDLNEEEIARYKELGAYYESLSKNIDADKDGIPDILSDKQLTISTIFFSRVGQWGINNTGATVPDTSQFYINHMIIISGGKGLGYAGGNISLSGPEEAPGNDITLHERRLTPDGPQGFLSSFKRELGPSSPDAPDWAVLRPFHNGAYTLTLDDNKSYSLNYSNVNSRYFMVLVLPKLHTNNEGKLVSISLEYKLPDNRTTIDPVNFLTEVMVHLSDQQEIYHSPPLTAETGFTGITLDTPVDISSLHHIDIGYNDLLGNQYDLVWQ